MKESKITEIKVGIMTLLGLLIFLFILGWAKDFELSENKLVVNVSFPNVAGLEAGDAVMVNGLKKGRVDQIKAANGKVNVRLILDSDTQLYENADYSIMMLDLMGGKKVEINPGSIGEFNPEKVYAGTFLGDISTAMAMLSSVQEDLVALTKDIRFTLEKTNEILGDEDFTYNLKVSVARLSNFAGELNQFLHENKNDFDSLLTNSNLLMKNTNKFMVDNREHFTEFLGNTNEFVQNTDSLIARLNVFIERMENQENNIGKIIYDPDFYSELKTTMDQLKEMTQIINDQLKGNGLKVEADVDLF